MSTFHTIKSQTEGVYKEKGSKFIGIAIPVSSLDQIKEALENLKSVYHDARHHCYAWVLGMEEQKHRANDDGEPSHSAGDPILGQIRSFELTNTLVVVVRYFGGTKLGVGGLIHAYKTSAEEALSKAAKVEIFEIVFVQMKFPYEAMSIAEKLINDFDIEVIERDFQMACKISGKMKKDLQEKFQIRTKDYYEIAFDIQ